MATKKTKSTTFKKIENQKIKCPDCGKERTANSQNFFKSNREEYEDKGYCTTCKSCLINSTIDDDGEVTMESIKYALKKLDKPLVEKVFMEVKNKKNDKGELVMTNKRFIGAYSSQINLYDEYKDCRFSDTVDIQIKQEKMLNARVDMYKNQEVTDDMILFWGRNANLSNQDYLDLQNKFDNYIKYDSDLDPKKEQDYRQLCIYELQRDKLQYNIDKESVSMVKTYQAMINEIADNLGIQAIQKKEEFGSEKLVLGLITRYIEDVKKRPIPRYIEDLGGEDKIKEIAGIEYVGGICESMGIKNNRQKEYDEMMKEAKVHPHELLTHDEDDD